MTDVISFTVPGMDPMWMDFAVRDLEKLLADENLAFNVRVLLVPLRNELQRLFDERRTWIAVGDSVRDPEGREGKVIHAPPWDQGAGRYLGVRFATGPEYVLPEHLERLR